MTTDRNRFTVIENKEFREDSNKKERTKSYQTSPFAWQSESIREKFIRYVNEESAHKFSIEDLLRC